jgi:hypothetical protein
MRNWAKEIQLLDQLVDVSLADVIKEKKPFTWGFFAACLLLLRYRPYEMIEDYVHAILNDAGTKTEDGADGVYIAVDNLGKKGDEQQQIFRGMLEAFDMWEQRTRGTLAKARKCEPLAWSKKQRDAQRDAIKTRSTIDAAE